MPDQKVKVGKLSLKPYAAEKPVAITAAGKMLKLADVHAKPSLALGSLHSLDMDLQVKLATERTRMEPDFTLGIFNIGNLTKQEILDNVEAKTELGLEIVRAEMAYCNELLQTVSSSTELATWPQIAESKAPPIPKDWEWVPEKYRRFVRSIALFCENSTDSITKYAADYRIKHVHSVFKAKGFVVVALSGVDDNAYNFTMQAKNRRVVYLGGIGHGAPDCYTGHMNQPLLRVGFYDPAVVRGKVIHLLSCQTAKALGPDTVRNGARAYAGYFENFTFVYDNPATPINEMDLFWKADSTFDIVMANGGTVEQAHLATIAAYKAAIAAVPNTAAATWLNWDMNYLRDPVINAIYGDKAAKIFPWLALPFTPFMEIEEAMMAQGTTTEEEFKEAHAAA